MQDEESRRRDVLGAVAFYAKAMRSEHLGDCASGVNAHRAYLDNQLIGRLREFESDVEASIALHLLGLVAHAASARDSETTRRLLCNLAHVFPLESYPPPQELGELMVDVD